MITLAVLAAFGAAGVIDVVFFHGLIGVGLSMLLPFHW